jgi:hypothetical protein
MNELLLTLIDPEDIMAQIHRITLAEAWVKLYRMRCPRKWPTVTAVVTGLEAIGQTCGRHPAQIAISNAKIYETQITPSGSSAIAPTKH